MSTPLSRANLRTDGIAKTRLPSPAGAPVGAPGPAGAAGAATAAGAASGAASAAGAASPSSSWPGASISTKTSPTRATVPSWTKIFKILPVTGDGISSTDLSFWISTNVSSSWMVSPSLTSHFTISPSAIPSPISGNLNLKAMLFTSFPQLNIRSCILRVLFLRCLLRLATSHVRLDRMGRWCQVPLRNQLVLPRKEPHVQ